MMYLPSHSSLHVSTVPYPHTINNRGDGARAGLCKLQNGDGAGMLDFLARRRSKLSKRGKA